MTVGMDFGVRLLEQTTASWEFWFGLLERYVAENGHARVPRPFVNRPGMSGDSTSWEGWSHARWFIEEVPAGAAGAGGSDGRRDQRSALSPLSGLSRPTIFMDNGDYP